jgi:drug/metabolite transporter (DMT)-like permease
LSQAKAKPLNPALGESTGDGGVSKMGGRGKGIAALLLVQLFFGLFPYFIHLTVGDGVGGKEGYIGFPPRAVAGWRIVFAALVLGVLAWRKHGRGIIPPRAEVPRLVACALLGVVLNMSLAIEGAARISVVSAGLLFTLIPVFTYGTALALRVERFSHLRSLGIALSLSGAITLILGSNGNSGELGFGGSELFGALLIVVNCVGYAIYLVIARPLLARTDATLFLARVFGISLVFAPPLLWSTDAVPAGLGVPALWGMAYILVFPTLLAYLLNAFALARVSSSTTAAFIYLQPLIGGAAGIFARGEEVGGVAWLAALLLFLGLGLVLKKRPG